MATRADAEGERELRERAGEALQNAYASYSRVRVGAAVSGQSGRVYAGANVENASYGLTICAERAAVAQAVAAGERRLVALATASERGGSTPCGACRQVLAEFMDAAAPVHFLVEAAERSASLADLPPGAFALDYARRAARGRPATAA